jgi:hypothetical protein
MRIVRFGATLAALVFGAHVLAAQQPASPGQPGHRHGGVTADSGMGMHMRMDSLNARLDTLVTRMNAATGNRKVAAMADVINELVAQRRAMQGHMHKMMDSHKGMMRMREKSPAPEADSAPADTAGHAGHHPPG